MCSKTTSAPKPPLTSPAMHSYPFCFSTGFSLSLSLCACHLCLFKSPCLLNLLSHTHTHTHTHSQSTTSVPLHIIQTEKKDKFGKVIGHNNPSGEAVLNNLSLYQSSSIKPNIFSTPSLSPKTLPKYAPLTDHPPAPINPHHLPFPETSTSGHFGRQTDKAGL